MQIRRIHRRPSINSVIYVESEKELRDGIAIAVPETCGQKEIRRASDEILKLSPPPLAWFEGELELETKRPAVKRNSYTKRRIV